MKLPAAVKKYAAAMTVLMQFPQSELWAVMFIKKANGCSHIRFMFMDMDGLRDGDSRTGDSENRGMGNYMMLPEDMTMKMHMLGMMYGVH